MTRKISDGRYGKTFSKVLTKEFLETEYVQKKRSPYSISNEVGCSVKNIYNYLKHYGISIQNINRSILIGNQFGLLTVQKEIGRSKNGTAVWECVCECGQTRQVKSSELKSSKILHCGCSKKSIKGSNNTRWKGHCDISGARVSEIRFRAKKKNINFDLDAKFLWELFENQDKKCAITGLHLDLDSDASLDRISSQKGYTKDNVWWVHKDVNKMKMDFELDYFFEMCEKITNARKN